MARLPETKWNTNKGHIGTREISDSVAVIRTYEENGRTITVYAAACSPDLLGENKYSANRSANAHQNIIYPGK